MIGPAGPMPRQYADLVFQIAHELYSNLPQGIARRTEGEETETAFANSQMPQPVDPSELIKSRYRY